MSMDPAQKRRLGRTALEVTALGFGGAPIGGFRATIPEQEAQALLDAAWDGGVRLYDTSPFYGRGMSEVLLGLALRDVPRDQYLLCSKLGRYDLAHFDFSPRRVAESIDVSPRPRRSWKRLRGLWYRTRARSMSATGSAKPARCRAVPQSRTPAKGTTRADTPPADAASAA